jgi:iron complex transport system substrate-binding protein
MDAMDPQNRDILETIGRQILDSAFLIHTKLGPGLLESVYEVVLANKLARAGLRVERQVPVPIEFEGIRFEEGFRADLIVEQVVLVELKSVEALAPVHAKQTLTYLKLAGMRLGLLINFGAPQLKNGIKRLVNNL